MPDLIVTNGIHGRTGKYLVAALDPTAASAEARSGLARLKSPSAGGGTLRALPVDVPPRDPARAGWGVLWAPGTPQAVRDALRPLIDQRKGQVEGDRFHEIELNPGESAGDLLVRHGIGGAAIDPPSFPYYVLIVGGPDVVPWETQRDLSGICAVGRLAFETAAGYDGYARSVVGAETAPPTRQKLLACWGPRHPGDQATQLSADCLVTPLALGAPKAPAIAGAMGFDVSTRIGEEATKSSLLDLIAGKASRPAVLFTASHGLGFEPDDPEQRALQGALLTMDWPAIGAPAAEHALAAADVPDDANLAGMIAFLFACYGAGSPARDEFPFDAARQGQPIAPAPFVAALPNRLLGHPGGGALAVIGHVERAWGYSIQPPEVGPTLQPFRNLVGRLMKGEPVGHAVRDFPERYLVAAALLLRHYDANTTYGKLDATALLRRWIECCDARNYCVLGDPAVRLRPEEMR